MKKNIINTFGFLFLISLMFTTSCVTYYTQGKVKEEIRIREAIASGDEDAIRVAQSGGNLDQFGISPTLGDAYREKPWLMGGATLVDLLAIGYVANEVGSSGGSSGNGGNDRAVGSDGGSAASVSVSGSTNGGDINVNIGQSSSRDSQTVTTTTNEGL